MARWRDNFHNATEEIYKCYRRFFGTYSIEDPRPRASKLPYTFLLPSQAELDAVAVGDTIQLLFRGLPQSREFGAERMWVLVTAISQTSLEGTLDNIPADMPQISLGDTVRFQQFHILSTNKVLDGAPFTREYWARCLVDKCVADDRVPVHYLYREEPDMAEVGASLLTAAGEFVATIGGLTDQEIDGRPMEYIALGAVLNADDSWLHLVDEPIGSRFIRDFTTGRFVPDGDS